MSSKQIVKNQFGETSINTPISAASAQSYVDSLSPKTAVNALAAVVVADATDLPTAIALANANKVAINLIITALKTVV